MGNQQQHLYVFTELLFCQHAAAAAAALKPGKPRRNTHQMTSSAMERSASTTVSRLASETTGFFKRIPCRYCSSSRVEAAELTAAQAEQAPAALNSSR